MTTRSRRSTAAKAMCGLYHPRMGDQPDLAPEPPAPDPDRQATRDYLAGDYGHLSGEANTGPGAPPD